MPELEIKADGTLVKGAFIVLLGAFVGAIIKYVWDMTLGRMLDQATQGRL